MSITAAMGCAAAAPEKRKASDFYPTPPEFTRAFLNAERDFIIGRVWEPAAGDGAIVRVLLEAGFDVFASDLVDRGAPDVTVDNFLNFDRARGQAIVTNPPYGSNLPERFVRHALYLRIPYIALFLKANYLHAKRARRLFADWPPCAYYPMTSRPDWTGNGSPTMDMTWYVWDAKRAGVTVKLLDTMNAPCAPAPQTLELFAGAA